jgi:hypothetical protein
MNLTENALNRTASSGLLDRFSAKIAACKALLIEERKRLLGDRWRENCPFEVDE